MISPVHKYKQAYADAGADIITIHPEATENLKASILKIKELDKKVGISLNPETEIDKVTTPQGCTITGLNEMEHQGLSSSLIKGLMASFEKINEIKMQ